MAALAAATASRWVEKILPGLPSFFTVQAPSERYTWNVLAAMIHFTCLWLLHFIGSSPLSRDADEPMQEDPLRSRMESPVCRQ